MSAQPSSVECPVCGERFDPSAAGGWCTNADCGEYRWEADESAVDESDTAGGDDTSSTDAAGSGIASEDAGEVVCSNCGKHVPDMNFCKECGAELVSTTAPETSADGAAAGSSQATEADSTPAETTEASGTGDATSDESAASGTAGAGTGAATDTGTSADAGTSNTGADADASAGVETGTSAGTGTGAGVETAEAGVGPGAEASGDVAETGPELGLCPNCGEDIDDSWSVCPFCETDLDQHRQAAREAAAGPSEATETTADTGRTTERTESPPERVVVSIGDRELEAEDGDTIGAAVRTAHVEAGGDTDEAQWISREHVRFERDGQEFYVVDTSTNGTKLNGTELDDNGRRAVSDGDRIDFAGVTTGTVHIE